MDHFITARSTGDKLRADHLVALQLDPDVSRFLGEGRIAPATDVPARHERP